MDEVGGSLFFCGRFDCSSDELVEHSLADLLQRKFPQPGVPSLLVADEYHLLSEDHKVELLRWIETRLQWLRAVLVGNRTESIDHELLLELETKVERQQVSIFNKRKEWAKEVAHITSR
jgi:hypothetical protein